MAFIKKNKASAKQSKAQDPLVAVDIGTTKIRLMSAEVNEDSEINVLYYDETNSVGLVNGSVSDLAALSACLSDLVAKYESATDRKFTNCILGISGRHILSKNETGTVNVPTRIITEEDRENVLQVASSIDIGSAKYHMIHIIPQSYAIEGSEDVTNPIGLSAWRLGVGVHIVSCMEDQENNLRAAIEKIGPDVEVDQVIYNGIASADAVLSQGEKDIGVCLIDFGGGAVNVSVYETGKLVMTFGFDYGGGRLTREIATTYGIPLKTAETLKCQHGIAHPELLDKKDSGTILMIPVRDGGQDDKIFISRTDLAKTISVSLADTFRQVCNRLENYSRENSKILSLGAGFVLTGGVANTQGIAALGANRLTSNERDNYKVKVRVGTPRGVESSNPEVLKTDCSTIIGLIRFGYSIQQDDIRNRLLAEERRKNAHGITKLVNMFKDWYNREF